MRGNRPVLVTTSWDDGHPLDMRLADLLAKYDLGGTFYVPLEAERGVLTAGQIRELATRFEIGAHTVHHRVLTELTAGQARQEIALSRTSLQEITGRACATFCFPKGKYARCHLGMVRDAGFAAARTVQLMSVAPPSRRKGLLVMPTSVQVFSHSLAGYGRNLAKRWHARGAWNWLAHCRRLDWAALGAALLALALRKGGVLHLWGHSWEIEESGQWGRLEDFFRLLAGQRGRVEFATNHQVCNYKYARHEP